MGTAIMALGYAGWSVITPIELKKKACFWVWFSDRLSPSCRPLPKTDWKTRTLDHAHDCDSHCPTNGRSSIVGIEDSHCEIIDAGCGGGALDHTRK